MPKFLFVLFALPLYCFSQQNFEPIPADVKTAYQFNLQKNFFASEADYYRQLKYLTNSLTSINTALNGKTLTPESWVQLIRQYAGAEANYRVIDLYLFLRFAQNMDDSKADAESDSIRAIIRKTRTLIKQKIAGLPVQTVQKIIAADSKLAVYINKIKNDKIHLLDDASEKMLAPSAESRSAGFYRQAMNSMNFLKLKTADGEIDVIKQRSAWENSSDSNIRKLGQQYVLDGYATQKDFIGYHYIAFIKALNAYAINKNFDGLLDEKEYEWALSKNTVPSFFTHIIAGAKQKDKIKKEPETGNSQPMRFTITDAVAKIENALGILGPAYKKELHDLLNPLNGRIDLSGNGNRIPMRGTASVYPIFPSVFYALNYEGYLIDLSLLAHEAGHAVQASLMHNNKVPLLYATGPAYFTESFGKFNELLLFDYLSNNEKDTVKRKIYATELHNRIDVLFGSTLEALVEYDLIKGIVNGSINTPADLDSVTQHAGMLVDPEIFAQIPEYRGLWMVLETNYQAPLHNVNDMIAAALAIKYYQLYKAYPQKFVSQYVDLLSQGYNDTPANMLKKLSIDIEAESFIQTVVDFAIKN